MIAFQLLPLLDIIQLFPVLPEIVPQRDPVRRS
jgi:hypothetical protein